MHGRSDRPVLIVDDSADVREILSLLLEGEGYPTLCADSGDAALDLLQHGAQPFVILLDWMMPGMDGEAVRAELRADPRTASIPVVVVTASPQLGGHAPADGTTLVKPFDADELLHVVGEHHGRSWPP